MSEQGFSGSEVGQSAPDVRATAFRSIPPRASDPCDKCGVAPNVPHLDDCPWLMWAIESRRGAEPKGLLAEEPFADRLARRFHEVYEEAAPGFGWETQPRSRVPWAELPDENRRLMGYVAGRITEELRTHVVNEVREELRRVPREVSERLAEIQSRADAATPAPWLADDGDVYKRDADGGYIELIEYGTFYDPADGEFAAHARADIEWLLSLLRQRVPEPAEQARNAQKDSSGQGGWSG